MTLPLCARLTCLPRRRYLYSLCRIVESSDWLQNFDDVPNLLAVFGKVPEPRYLHQILARPAQADSVLRESRRLEVLHVDRREEHGPVGCLCDGQLAGYAGLVCGIVEKEVPREPKSVSEGVGAQVTAAAWREGVREH